MHDQLIAYVKASRNIDQWNEPFLGAILLKSSMPAAVLAHGFNEFFAGKTLHIMVPVSATATGILPKSLWDWINTPDAPMLSELLKRYGQPDITNGST